jgi:hypothetical protein
MNPIADGLARGFRGVRTGDQRSLYTGALLLAYGLWRRNRGRRDLLYTRTLNPGEAIIVKASRGTGHEIVVGDELADKIRASKRPLHKT